VGHGRSDGERAVIASWDHYVEDARRLAVRARERHPGVPVIVVGHSAGAVAAYLLAVRHPELASALVLSAGPLRPLGWALEVVDGDATDTEDGDPTTVLSTHPEYVHALLHDPLTYKGGFRPETLLALSRTWPEIDAALVEGRPDVPVLLVHGDADQVVPLADSRHVASTLPYATLATFPGDLHDVVNEHDRDTVHDTIAAFLLGVSAGARVGHGAAA
jgi:alpha-beta hydrolase superfamily lysophospholipase